SRGGADHDLVRPRGSGRHRRHRDHPVSRPHGCALPGRQHRHGGDPRRHHASDTGGRMIQRASAGSDMAATAAAAGARARLDLARLFAWAQTIGIVVLLAAILATPGFLAGPSILSLLTTVSFIGCVAVGMTLITISGNIMSFAL